MDQLNAQERVRDRPPSSRPRSSVAHRPPRPAPVESPPPAWREIAERLAEESNARERLLRRVLALADTVAVAIALILTSLIVDDAPFMPWAAFLFPGIVAAAKILGLYESDGQRIRKTTVEELPRLAQLGTLLVLAVWLAGDPIIGHAAGQDQALVLGAVFVLCSMLGRRAARTVPRRQAEREQCLFIGDERSYARLSAIFERHDLPAKLLDRVPIDEAMTDGSDDRPDEPQALLGVIANAGAHRVIIGPHAFTNDLTFELVEAAREAGTRVSLLPDMLEVVGSSVDFDDLYGVTLLGVRHTSLSRSSQRVKRAFDFAGASIALVLTAPLMAIIAIAIRRDSPGPALFRQSRIGRGGHAFVIYKFRTMVDGADARKEELRSLNEADGLFKITADPRLTHIGRRLRRCSLDELPQLFNVLLGQMSLVGPRPLVADEQRILGARPGRLRLTPGMTGQWQIAGSARVPLEDMVKLDHLYVSNWTIWGDIKILLRTVPYVLSCRGR